MKVPPRSVTFRGLTDCIGVDVSDRTCTVQDCERTFYAKGYCGGHYQQWNTGRPLRDLQQRGRLHCEFPGCGKKHVAKGLCNGHYKQSAAGIALRPLPVPNSATTYQAVHARLLRKRGKASALTCIDCGAVAREWAYQHDDQLELTATLRFRGKEFHVAYSADMDHYAPMCKPCHLRFDQKMSKQRECA